MRHPLSPTSAGRAFPTSTAGQTVLIFDDGTAAQGNPAPAPSYSHVVVAFMLDQPVTFVVKWAPNRDAADGELAIINGSDSPPAGVLVAANTYYTPEVTLEPGRNQISVVMGTPAPTANFIAAEANTYDGALI